MCLDGVDVVMIFLAKNERQQISRLFAFLLQGEQLAFDCAKRQSVFFTDTWHRRFLANQARQERFHAAVFRSASGMLTPKGLSAIPGKREFEQYGMLLSECLQRNDSMGSLLGMQILLEGLGDVALNHIDAGFELRGIDGMCQRVRYLILGQEDAHHQFGINTFQNLLGEESEISAQLRQQCQDYLELIEQLMESTKELFHYFDENTDLYMDEFYQSLPVWVSEQRK